MPRLAACCRRICAVACVFIIVINSKYIQASESAGLSGWLLERLGYGIDPAHRELAINEQLLQLEWNKPDIYGWRVDAKLWAQRESELEPSVFHDVGIRELNITRQAESSTLTLGRQIVVWGKADGFRLLDVVNPIDLREFVLGDDVRTRLPLWMINAQWFRRDDEQWQFLLIPQTYHDRLPQAGGEFDPYSDLRQPGITLLPVQVPANTPANWSVGARWARTFGDVDFSLIALNNLESTPVLFTSMSTTGVITVEPRIVKHTIIGVTLDTSIGQTVLRGELAVSPDEYRLLTDATGMNQTVRRTAVRSLVGIDWYVHDWLISPQLFNCHAPGSPGVGTEPDGTYASLTLERKFYYDKFMFKAFEASALSRNDNWLSLEFHYQLQGNIEAAISADWLSGDSAAFFGQFGNRDRVVFSLKGYF